MIRSRKLVMWFLNSCRQVPSKTLIFTLLIFYFPSLAAVPADGNCGIAVEYGGWPILLI
ncbi:MAG: hypothetical protein H7Y86_09035 [Rhizobacter sp.]|nr:hypothetical protein [Ferruginibacter sp.]